MKRILWIEDAYDDIEDLVKYKNGQEYEFDIEQDHNEAIRKIENESYDAYIIDLFLVGSDHDALDNGIAVLERFRQLNISKPLIIYTNLSKRLAKKYCLVVDLLIRKKKPAKRFFDQIEEHIENFK